MNTPNYENLKIGTQMYAVHEKYPKERLNNGKVIVCRVKTFENRSGKIYPVLAVKGDAKRTVDPRSHRIYTQLSQAIDAIRGHND